PTALEKNAINIYLHNLIDFTYSVISFSETLASKISIGSSFRRTSLRLTNFSISKASLSSLSDSSQYRLCFVMSYLSLKNGLTPRNCRIHFTPSITASSSLDISSLPQCQVVNQNNLFVSPHDCSINFSS